MLFYGESQWIYRIGELIFGASVLKCEFENNVATPFSPLDSERVFVAIGFSAIVCLNEYQIGRVDDFNVTSNKFT